MTFEAIAIPYPRCSFQFLAQFLHDGEVKAFAISPEDERAHSIRPYQTLTIKIHDWQDQFCSVTATNLIPC